MRDFVFLEIEKYVHQAKLFIIEANSNTKSEKNVPRKAGVPPTHVPELYYKDLFEDFLKSLV